MENLLFTGASGFLGQSITSILKDRYLVDTLNSKSRAVYTVDLGRVVPVLERDYDLVLHAAGKAHFLPRSKEEEAEFFQANFEGTKNLCRALERTKLPISFVFVSTVAVYGCETGIGITEDHPLNGRSAYALSKIQAELYLREWAERTGVILTILRPALLAGVDPPGNLGAMIRGIKSGLYFHIDGGLARKSVAMAEDIGRLLPIVAPVGGTYNLCDDRNPSYHEWGLTLAKILEKKPPRSISSALAWVLGEIGELTRGRFPMSRERLKKLRETLTFSNQKLKTATSFQPTDVLTTLEQRGLSNS